MPHSPDEKSLSRREMIGRMGLGAASLPLLGSFEPLLSQGAGKAAKKLGIGLRTLGRTGMKIPEIIIGTARLNESNARIVEAALDQGLTFIDTARGYTGGRSETAIGRILKARGKRDKVFIATKASGFPHARMKNEDDEKVEEYIKGFVEDSLKKLRTDYIDVYFIQHGANNPRHIDYPQQWKAVEKLKKEGKIRAVALSTHSNFKAVSEAAIKCGKYDVIMPVINAPTMDPEVAKKAAEDTGRRRRRRRRRLASGIAHDMRGVVASCRKKKVGLIAMKAAQPSFFPGATWKAGVEAYGKGLEKMSDHQILFRKVLLDDIAGVNIGLDRMSYLEEALALEDAMGGSPKKGAKRRKL